MDKILDLVIEYLPAVLVLFFCLPVHEFSHAFAADKLGDPTPRRDGRLSLNPFHHLDLVGSICLIFAGFGWAKPVIVNPFNLRERRGGMAIVALAGPVSNLLMMIPTLLLAKLFYFLSSAATDEMSLMVLYDIGFVFAFIAYINLTLAVFNLLPVPPLDGSKILYFFLPDRIAWKIQENERIIGIVFMAILVLGNTGILTFGFGNTIGAVIKPIWSVVGALFGTPTGLEYYQFW